MRTILNTGIVIFALLLATLTAAAIGGFFTTPLIISAVAAGGVLFLVIGVRELFKKRFPVERLDGIAIAVILLFTLLTAFYQHDYSRGRDDMGYLSAAAKIVGSESLSFSDIISRPYHPFRAIGQDIFTSQFLPGYTSYLAAWYMAGGITGVGLGNTLLYAISLVMIFLIARRLFGKSAGLLALLFYATLYTSLWFPRRINSENLSLVLLLMGAFLLVSAIKEKKIWYYSAASFVISLTALVRGEAVAYAGVGFLLACILILRTGKKPRAFLPALLALIVATTGVIGMLFVYGARYGAAYFEYAFLNAGDVFHRLPLLVVGIGIAAGAVIVMLVIRKKTGFRFLALQKPAAIIAACLLVGAEIGMLVWTRISPTVVWDYFKPQYVLENFTFYFFLPYGIMLLFGMYAKINLRIAALGFLPCIPGLIFLISPSIAVDQPWFMRRFFGVLIAPVIIIAAGACIHAIRSARIRMILITVLLIGNLSASASIFFLRNNDGVSDQLTAFARRFSKNDIIFMEPGWHWQQWGYPLHYLDGLAVLPNIDQYSADDLRSLLATHDAVYILSSRTTTPHPLFADEDLEYLGPWTLSYPSLIKTVWINAYIEEHADAIPLARLREAQIGTPPGTTEQIIEDLHLYRLKEKRILEDRIPTIPTFSNPEG